MADSPAAVSELTPEVVEALLARVHVTRRPSSAGSWRFARTPYLAAGLSPVAEVSGDAPTNCTTVFPGALLVRELAQRGIRLVRDACRCGRRNTAGRDVGVPVRCAVRNFLLALRRRPHKP